LFCHKCSKETTDSNECALNNFFVSQEDLRLKQLKTITTPSSTSITRTVLDKSFSPLSQEEDDEFIRTVNSSETSFKRHTVCISSPLPQVASSTKNLPILYPPGRILHIVRKYPRSPNQRANNSNFETDIESNNLSKKKRKIFSKKTNKNKEENRNRKIQIDEEEQDNQPVYQLIETDNKNFNELLISPRMLQDHMPDNLIKCMKAVLDEPAPKKPPRQFLADYERVTKSNETSTSNQNPTEHHLKGKQSIGSGSGSRKRLLTFANLKKLSVLKQLRSNFNNELSLKKSCPKQAQVVNELKENNTRYGKRSTENIKCLTDKMSAPLAKQESMSDIFIHADELQDVPYAALGINNQSLIFEPESKLEDLYYDDSINMRNPAICLQKSSAQANKQLGENDGQEEEEEEKSNMVWWPLYQDSTTYSLNKSKQANMNKAHSNYDEENMNYLNMVRANELRIATSTPRANHTNRNKTNNTMSLASSPNHQERTANDKVCDLFKNNSENLTESASTSFSFSNLPDNTSNIYKTDDLTNLIGANSYAIDIGNSQTISNGMLQCLNINESMTTCYTSIEKLAIIKPQSKDYILCFDTSSIDQTSSNTSCDLNNLANLLSASEILNSNSVEIKSHTDNSVLSSTYTSTASNEDNGRKKTIKVILTKSDNDDSREEKKVILLNSLDYPDSGIESARTLSPQIYTNNSNTIEFNSNRVNQMISNESLNFLLSNNSFKSASLNQPQQKPNRIFTFITNDSEINA
jgi:hypothetical protein